MGRFRSELFLAGTRFRYFTWIESREILKNVENAKRRYPSVLQIETIF